LSSFGFDAFLWLLNGEDQVIAIDDDTGDAMGALISRFSLPQTGTSLIAVGSHDAGETGAYTLSLNEAPWVNYSGGDPEEIFIGEQVSGDLTDSSPQFRTGQFFNAYRFEASPRQAVSIEMRSEQFDSYLWLLDNKGRVITVNDDRRGQITNGFASEIIFFPPISSTYFVVASSSTPIEIGKYDLILKTTHQPTQAKVLSETVSDKLDASDFQLNAGQYLDVYSFEGEIGKSVTIGLSSSGFDSYLRILDSAGNVLREDDDSGVKNDDALIEDFELPESGHYYVWVSSVFAGEHSDYVLSLNEPLPSPRRGLEIRTEESLKLVLNKKRIGEDFAEQGGRLSRKGQPFTNAIRCVGDTTPYTAKVLVCVEKPVKKDKKFVVKLSDTHNPKGINISGSPQTVTIKKGNKCTTAGMTSSGYPEIKLTVKSGASADVYKIKAEVGGLGSDSEDMNVIDVQKIPLGGSANLTKWIIGKLYVPTKWGGKITLSGSNIELFYTDGSDLDCETTGKKIFKGELDAKRVAQEKPINYEVPENKHGWYYVKITNRNQTAISSTFVQEGEAGTTPWNGWYWPKLDTVNPNLYDKTGLYTPLKDYDSVYTTTERTTEKTNYSGGSSWEGHCWGWSLAAIAKAQPAATIKNGVSFNKDEMEGLYTELAEGATTGWTWRVGKPNNEIPASPCTAAKGEPVDSWPDNLHNGLRTYIKQQKKAMNADLRDGSLPLVSTEVWNHDVYKYEATMEEAA
jgi:hypothetical protein